MAKPHPCSNILSASCLHFTGKKALLFDTIHPFGQKAQISKGQWSTTAQNNAAYTLSNLHDITSKGYTGHEHIDAFELIHMVG